MSIHSQEIQVQTHIHTGMLVIGLNDNFVGLGRHGLRIHYKAKIDIFVL